MGAGKQDQELARRIAQATKEVTKEYHRDLAVKQRLETWSYSRRFNQFVNEHMGKQELRCAGQTNWYSSVPMYLTFTDPVLNEWFNDGEPKPCLMLGSIYAIKAKYMSCFNATKYRLPTTVFNRWMRRQRITCLSQLHMNIIRRNVCDRLRQKWDGDIDRSLPSIGWSPFHRNGWCYIDGVLRHVETKKQWETLVSINDLAQKINNGRIRTKIAA